MLPAGHRVGPYVVVSPLGSGGMGDVYLADDTRLRRRVALKVLSAGKQSEPQASERLLREARAAARLDHANICTIFDTGEADGHAYIAMQYVEGESLASRLKRKPLDLREALGLAAQAAHALAEAHRQGIVHRDVKPENVMLTTSGHVKLLDFGLAQTTGPLADQATTFERLTEAGAVAGTVRYMSPEQVKGEPIDERSDIFSLGTVLYQAIARAHPLGEGSVAETIAAILTREPAALPDAVPADVRRIIGKSLEKDSARRYQSASDLAVDLENALRPAAIPAGGGRGRRGVLVAALGGALVVAAVGVGWWLVAGRSATPLDPSEFVAITDFADSAVAPALSPDGRMVAFIRGTQHFLSSGQIYVKLLPNGEAKQLTNDPRDKYGPAFTADGSRVAFTTVSPGSGWETWTVPVLGGEPTRLMPNAAGLTWIGDGQVLFSEIKGTGLHMGLVSSTETRANRREVYFPEHERAMAHYSSLSPDRTSVLVVQMSRTGGFESCRVVPFDGSSAGRPVGPPGACTSAAWSPDGNWMYFTVDDGVASHVWRQRAPNGTPEAVTSSPTTSEWGVAIAPDGRSLITSVGRQSHSLWWRDATGDRPLSPEGFATIPRLSRDGRLLYFLLQRAPSPHPGLAVLELSSGRTEVLLPDVWVTQFELSPSGRTVAYSSTTTGGAQEIWVAAVDRSSAPRRLVESADTVFFLDEETVVVRALEGRANFVDRVRLDGTARARVDPAPVLQLGGVTPDGRWVLIHRGGDARGLALTTAISIDGATSRAVCAALCFGTWTPDARHLFLRFTTQGRTLVVPVPPGKMFPDAASGADPLLAWEQLPGARWLNGSQFAPVDASTYVFAKREDLRNLFRIPIR